MAHSQGVSKQCEYVEETGERCDNIAKQGSVYCRRCELKIQKKFQLLDYPSQDFFETHKPLPFAKPLALVFFLGFSFLIFPSALNMSYFGIVELIKSPLTSETLLSILSLAIFGLLVIGLYFFVLLQLLSEIATSSERKYLHRARFYKLIGFFIFPLLIAYLFTLLLIGNITGWDKATSSDWLTIAGLIISIYYPGLIFLILRKPLLYFHRGVSALLDLSIIITGATFLFQPVIFGVSADSSFSKIIGVLGISFGLGMLTRTLSRKETLAQQIIVQIYRLPALLQTFISSDQRRLALAIGLGKFQNLTNLQREELLKYLVEKHVPSIKEKIVNTLKFVVVTFLIALLIESPASYIFDMVVESFKNK